MEEQERLITEANLRRWIGEIMADRPVMGVRERPDQPGFHHFDWLPDPEAFTPDYTTTTIPPKKAFFPPLEPLFRFSLEDPPVLTPMGDDFPFLLLGVHPCDLAALDALDRAYAHPPAEVRWGTHRNRATIVGVDCTPDEYCFCNTMGAAFARTPCDLFLTPVERGFLVEIHTDRGAALLEGADTEPVRDGDRESAAGRRRKKADAITAAWEAPPKQVARILEAGEMADIWEETAKRCYSCGSCNTTCPTCFCFDITDDLELDLTRGIRRRTWDSCQLPEFAVVAGGHNFREERWQRLRHRWRRKFLYLHRQFGRPYCTGCGRCSRACAADINIVDVTNRLIRRWRKTEAAP